MKSLWLMLILLLYSTSYAAIQIPEDQLPPNGWEGIKWDHENVSGWDKTAFLSKVYIQGSFIHFPYSTTYTWPTDASGAVVGNSWIILKYNGQWIASTWDYLRPGQTFKATHAVGGGAIPSVPADWLPTDGEELYFFVSGFARSSVRNVYERSNVIRYYWNGAVGYPPKSCEGQPVINSFTSEKKGNSVFLLWNVTDPGVLTITTDEGQNIYIPDSDDLSVGKVEVVVTKDTVFTLKVNNFCSVVGAVSASIEINMSVFPINVINYLFLRDE